MSEQKAEQTSAKPGSLSAGPAVPNSSDVQSQPVAASAQEPTSVDSPDLVPEQAGAGETARMDAPKPEAPPTPGKIMIMSSGDRAWDSNGTGPEPKSGQNSGIFGKRRISARAAVVALAVVAGALGGALATAGFAHLVGDDATSAGNRALEASVARIDADILALKASVEQTSKIGTIQFNKTSDRLDKVEKAQAEPAAKLAKLSDAVDRLRAAPPVVPAAVAAAPVAAKEVTGSISPPASAPKAEVARLPTVEGWVPPSEQTYHGQAFLPL